MLIPKRKWRYPLAIEREYSKLLVAYVKKEFEIVQSFVSEMADALIRNGIHNDAIGDWLGYLVDKIKRKVSATISAIPAINKIFSKVDKHVKTEQSETFKSVFGSESKVSSKPRDFEMLKTIWVNQNLTLIKSVDSQIMERIQYSLGQRIISAADKELLMKDLTQEIQEMAGVSEKRAALIGADQVGKLNGRLAQYRQMSAGIDRYVWRTMGDNRVRPQHAARSGIIYRWDSPPAGGHPGEAIRCRCTAQPVIDEDSFKISPIRGTYTIPKENDIILSEDYNEKFLENVFNFVLGKKGGGVIKNMNDVAGGIAGALNPNSPEAEEHAIRYYGLVRSMKTDCARIAKNTGFRKKDIEQIKNHVFYKEHELYDGEVGRFEPSYYMARSWQRLIEGKNIEERDIILLNHEFVESVFMAEGFSAFEAHRKAEAIYNYSATLKGG